MRDSRFEADLANVFFTDFADTATFDGKDVDGLFRVNDQRLTDLNGQLVPVQVTTLRVPSRVLQSPHRWAALKENDLVTVRGKTYRVRDQQQEQDGAVTMLVLA